ncbi:MAG: flippase-like domain-containing protein [Bacteroidales bacterium]|nr:flippase-like domain-containing protein [Bacteroidales bacterium]
MNKAIKALKYLIFSLLTLLFLYFVFKDVDVLHLLKDVAEANPLYILLSLFFALIGYLIRAARWQLIINASQHNVSFTNSFKAITTGYLANMLLPRLGEISRCAFLTKKESVPFDFLIGTVIVERIIDLIILFILLIITALYKLDFFGTFFLNSFQKAYLAIDIKLLLIIALTIFIVFGILLLLFRKKIIQTVFYRKISDFIKGILHGIFTIKHMQKRNLFIIQTIAIWLMYWLMTWIVFFAIEPTKNLDMIDGLFILIAGGIAMIVPVQNGFGAFHGIVASALTIYGLDFETEGLLFAVICHESQTILIVILGTFSILSTLSVFKKKNIKSKI